MQLDINDFIRMVIKMKSLLILFSVFLFSNSALACNVTISAGTNVISAAVNSASAGQTICMNTGTYTQSTSIELKQGQTLKGLGSGQTDTLINSSATNAVVLAPGSTVFRFHVVGTSPAVAASTAIIGHSATGATIWDVRIENFVDGIGLSGSDNSNLWNVYMMNTGSPTNSKPDPGVFLWSSDNVEVLYGYYEGENDGPYGDGGSIICWGSSELLIDHATFVYSGNSSVYFVDCDDSTVQNSDIYGSNEWGLDIVSGATAERDGAPWYLGGTDNFTAINNEIVNSHFGGSVFDEAENANGTYTNNIFTNNNQSATSGFCNGINVIGTPGNVDHSGNTVNTGSVICTYP